MSCSVCSVKYFPLSLSFAALEHIEDLPPPSNGDKSFACTVVGPVEQDEEPPIPTPSNGDESFAGSEVSTVDFNNSTG